MTQADKGTEPRQCEIRAFLFVIFGKGTFWAGHARTLTQACIWLQAFMRLCACFLPAYRKSRDIL